jgi:hypothetical protein
MQQPSTRGRALKSPSEEFSKLLEVGLYKLNPVDTHGLNAPGFNP